MKKKNRNERLFYVHTLYVWNSQFYSSSSFMGPNVCMLIIAGELCVRIREVEVRI